MMERPVNRWGKDALGVGEEQAKEALRLLDMAALMGGPLLHPAVDGAISHLKLHLQGLVVKPCGASLPTPTGLSHVGPPPGGNKKQRVWVLEAETGV